jgi:hypothetical protein
MHFPRLEGVPTAASGRFAAVVALRVIPDASDTPWGPTVAKGGPCPWMRGLVWDWSPTCREDGSDVDVDVDGGVVGGCLMRAGDLGVDVPVGRRVDVGRRPPQPVSFDAPADDQPG